MSLILEGDMPINLMNINNETYRKQFENSILKVKDFAKSFVNTIHEPFLLLDKDKKVIYVNKSFCDTFKVTVDETIGNVVYDIGKREWDIPKLRSLFDEILIKEKDFNGFEVEHNFPTIGHKIMMLNARIIEAEGEPENIILLAIEDITESRKKENELKEYEARFKRQFDTAHDGLLLIDYNGRIVNSNPAITGMLGYSVEDFKGKSLHDVGLIDGMEFQNVLLNLKDYGFVYFDYILAKTKEGKTIDTEIYLVDRTKFIQCNVRDITERKKTENELRIYHENLAKKVKESTDELIKKNVELERYNKLFVGREMRMIELKKLITELEADVEASKKPGIPPD